MPASIDCELIRNGLWGQPANAATSLVFVVVGVMLLRTRPVIGWLAAAVGAGSFLFHGPMPGWGEWAHDTTLAMLLIGLVFEQQLRWLVLAGIALAAGFAIWPSIAEAVTVVLAMVAVVAVIRSTSPAALALPAAVLGGGAAILVLSRSGGPLCDPESVLQGHAVWHVLAATALGLWARQTVGRAGRI